MPTPTDRDHTSLEAWHSAQEWEEAHWVNTQKQRARWGKNLIWRGLRVFGFVPKYRGDDYNLWWKNQFQDYRFLPKEAENALEVGCGPYTNIRLMLDRCRFRHIVLSDPLIRTYAKFKLTFVSEMYRNVACVLDDHPLEQLPFRSDFFDVVIKINVLDHVRDARRCMDNVVAVTKPGGWLIIGQDLTNAEDIDVLKHDPGSVGHPIKLGAEWFEPWLKDNFEAELYTVLPREQGRAAEHHYGTLIFAGRKK